MNAQHTPLHVDLEERLRFETLIADLSSKFVNLPAGEVDCEIMEAEHRICELLDIDLTSFWQWSDEDGGCFMLTHQYSLDGGAQTAGRMKHEDFPWSVRQLLEGRIVAISSLDNVPLEASKDRDVARQFGIKSSLCLPISVGGEPPLGLLCLNTTRAERDWSNALVQRLQVVAQIFANALARKRADHSFRASEARLAAGTELAGLGYYEVDYGDGHCFTDDRFREICGIPPDLDRGLEPVKFWLERVHPDDRPLILDERQKLHDGLSNRISTEYRYQHPSQGQKWIHHLARIASHRGDGHGVRTIGVVRDITQQKRVELEAKELHNELAHADRVTLLGQLASALAHELSQPLGAILRNAEAAEIMLQEPQPDVDELRAIVTDILRDDHRAGLVIDRLRSLLKRRSLVVQPIGLPGVIAEVMSLVRADAAARQVKLTYAAAPDLPRIQGDRIHLQQVLLNLLVNAMDAMDGADPKQRSIQIGVHQTDPATVEVRVCDSGPGIPVDSLDQLFEPFFTTKAKGMGMGLPVSKTIIEAHKGNLWAENRSPGGTCFCFTLRIAKGGGSKQ